MLQGSLPRKGMQNSSQRLSEARYYLKFLLVSIKNGEKDSIKDSTGIMEQDYSEQLSPITAGLMTLS